MTVFKDKFLIVIIDRGFSVYDIEKLEFIKHITTGFENVLSRSLCILKNGIMLVGLSNQFIAVYDLNDDFKEIEIWKYLCDNDVDVMLCFEKQGYIALGTYNFIFHESKCIYCHSIKRFLKIEEKNFWDLPQFIEFKNNI